MIHTAKDVTFQSRLQQVAKVGFSGSIDHCASPMKVPRRRLWSQRSLHRLYWACHWARWAGDAPPRQPRSVFNLLGDNVEFAGAELHVAITKLDREPAFQDKKSSVSGWACQTNSPFALTTITSWPLKAATIFGDQCSLKAESFCSRLTLGIAQSSRQPPRWPVWAAAAR